MGNQANKFTPPATFEVAKRLAREFILRVLSVGPIPRHVAFILDGNRRYGKKMQLGESGHSAGLSNLMSILRYCYDMGVQYASVYIFSIDNFKRDPSEVQGIMDLMTEKIEKVIKEIEAMNYVGVKLEFLGNLSLLDPRTREVALKVMDMTRSNSKMVVLLYMAYTSTDEIVRGVRVSCEEKHAIRGKDHAQPLLIKEDMEEKHAMKSEDQVQPVLIKDDIERNMYFSTKPEPDILIRTSGETRLSNFLLWQTSFCFLYAPSCLWPELSLRHLILAVLEYQRNQSYLDKFKKKL